jgi:hypothetical protein
MSQRKRRVPTSVHEERQLFEQCLERLLADGKEGTYVLFKGGEPQGFFASEQEAYEAGLDRFGLEPFLVDLVMKPKKSPWLPPSLRFSWE